MKVSNITNSIMENPLFLVIVALFVLLIILAIIRLFQPNFSMGTELGAHFGSIQGKIKLEAYENEQNSMDLSQMMNEKMEEREHPLLHHLKKEIQ